MSEEQKPQQQKEISQLSPIEALDFLSTNLAQLVGKRQDHVLLLQAEKIVRDALTSSSAPAVAP